MRIAGPEISALAGARSPVGSDGWATSFELAFTVTDIADGDSLDFDSVMFTTDPADELDFDLDTFGSIDDDRYGVTATPATVTEDETETKDVEITISISDKAGNTATETIMVMLAPRTVEDDEDDEDDEVVVGLVDDDTRNNVTEPTTFALKGMLASDSFIVLSESGAVPGILSDVTQMAVKDLPNIQRFFARGGTISLVGGSGAAGDAPNKSVVISEMMWGLNLGAEKVAEQPDYQWIELLNTDNALSDTDATNDAADDIDLSTYKLVFTPGTVVPKPAMLSDQVSNVEFLGWDVNIGQSGKIHTGDAPAPDGFVAEDLASMYRKINYTNLTKKYADKTAAENRTEQLKAIPDGNARGGWMESDLNNTYAINQLGSPGAQHFVGRSETTKTSATYAVVINEVGNNTGDSYDWIELRNTGMTEVDLKNWEITEITGADTETALVTFPNNSNHKIPGGGILLVVNSDPYRDPDHPVAAGTIINSDKLREEKTGINSRYYVDAGLKLGMMVRWRCSSGVLTTKRKVRITLLTLQVRVHSIT